MSEKKHCRHCGGGHVDLVGHEQNCVMRPPDGGPPKIDAPYRELLERVKAATGPDRELFIAVCDTLLGEFAASENKALWAYIEAGAWTDAALALVEKTFPGDESYVWRLQTDFGGLNRMTITLDDVTAPTKWQADGATPPLAILAALLTALSDSPPPSQL